MRSHRDCSFSTDITGFYYILCPIDRLVMGGSVGHEFREQEAFLFGKHTIFSKEIENVSRKHDPHVTDQVSDTD